MAGGIATLPTATSGRIHGVEVHSSHLTITVSNLGNPLGGVK